MVWVPAKGLSIPNKDKIVMQDKYIWFLINWLFKVLSFMQIKGILAWIQMYLVSSPVEESLTAFSVMTDLSRFPFWMSRFLALAWLHGAGPKGGKQVQSRETPWEGTEILQSI